MYPLNGVLSPANAITSLRLVGADGNLVSATTSFHELVRDDGWYE